MIWLAMVLAWMIVRAWEQGKAQAAAELRRGREHVAGQFRARMAAGAASSPWDDPWWWAAAGRRAWQSMRGARPGSSSTALPGSTPWRRIRSAAWAGAKSGARTGARHARERRQGRRGRPSSAGRPHGRPDEGGTGRRGGSRAGWRRRPGGRGRAGTGRERPWTRLGVCDDCGAVCARAALKPRQVAAGGRPETWLLCGECLRRHQDADRGPDPGGPAPAPGQGAVPAEEAPPLEASAPGSLPAADPVSEPAAPVTTTETEGDKPMSTELAVPGGNLPAVRTGDVTTYGGQQIGHLSDAGLLEELAYWITAMKEDLTAANAGRTQIANVQAWSARMEAEAALQRMVCEEIDRHLGPVAAAVDSAGGPEEVADRSYYEGIGA